MDAVGIILVLVALMALAGVVVFFIYDYYKHKDNNDKDFKAANTKVDVEKSDRLSNLKFVVDQVNDVNADIYNTMSSNVLGLQSNITAMAETTSNVDAGVASFLQFTNNRFSANPAQLKITELPGAVDPDIQLIQHVSALMGITASDLNATNAAKFCNQDKSRCIQFPDTNGDTYLTSLNTNNNLVMDATTRFKGDMKLHDGTGDQATISAVTDGLVIKTGNVGIGTALSNPQASLHIETSATRPALRIGSGTSPAVLVDNLGNIATSKNIYLRTDPADATSAAVATFSIDTAADNVTKILKVTANKVKVEGDLDVTGSVTIGGTGKIGTNTIQTIP